ncbi:hypothetical protein FOXYS1_8577 [Fusarium oxysporum]|uniref:Uncharacterized protein n=1 Tax=Fusarium oxysporum TaxID=5507 RepID=A0A8H5A9P1_FUSOX|nr:hypothetical protein FOXYS1_8577 [Fusarium oxysporum]
MSNHGFLVPDSYVFHVPNDVDMNLSSIFWGFSFAVALFSALHAGSQSLQTWRRKHSVTAYIAMIWAEWAASIVIGAVAWSFQRQYVKPSFQLFFITGLMSLPSKLVYAMKIRYLQFHPVAYLIKLFIEMNMADLIAKVAREPNHNAIGRHSQGYTGRYRLSMNRPPVFARPNMVHVSTRKSSVLEVEAAHDVYPSNEGIHVTVETAVTRKSLDKGDDSTSQSSLTRGI